MTITCTLFIHGEACAAQNAATFTRQNPVTQETASIAPAATLKDATRTADAAATVPGKLSAKWTYQDGQTVNEESRDLNLTGDGVTAFQISMPGGLPAGQYKVEISLDGAVVQSKDFEVKP